MAADSANDLELSLKKRARRRLVGAIALVLLMVVVLPMVLQDRSSSAPQEPIKISMPQDVAKPEGEVQGAKVAESIEPQVAMATAEPAATLDLPSETPVVDRPAVEQTSKNESQAVMVESKPKEAKPVEEKAKEKIEPKKDKPEAVKPVAVKPVEIKPMADKPTTPTNGSFTIQVGVFSDPENVKQLQAKLKQVGLASRTEKITTPKGEKIRLKAGTFPSREEAAYALTKVNAADLSGMVISNN